MNKDQVAGKLKDIGGKIQEEFVDAIDSPEQEAKGRAEHAYLQQRLDELRQQVLVTEEKALLQEVGLDPDAAGRYRLDTIVPGLYTGRTKHNHVKVQRPGGQVPLSLPGLRRRRRCPLPSRSRSPSRSLTPSPNPPCRTRRRSSYRWQNIATSPAGTTA